MNWLPIESAPKDGTYILLTDNNVLTCHLIARWRVGMWRGEPLISGKHAIWHEATHWMPLPAPPEPQA